MARIAYPDRIQRICASVPADPGTFSNQNRLFPSSLGRKKHRTIKITKNSKTSAHSSGTLAQHTATHFILQKIERGN
jgi:hypothetical protein